MKDNVRRVTWHAARVAFIGAAFGLIAAIVLGFR